MAYSSNMPGGVEVVVGAPTPDEPPERAKRRARVRKPGTEVVSQFPTPQMQEIGEPPDG